MDRELQLELTHYFESANDGSAQENFLRELANEEVQRGICLHLVLTWMLLYKRANNTKAPNIIWQEMKTPSMIKQIANNQRAYININETDNGISESITLLGLINNATVNFEESADIQPLMNITLGHTPMNLLCIYLYKGNELVGGHAIGAIKHNEKLYLFDPNVGVMQVPYEEKDILLSKVSYIYETRWGNEIMGKYIYMKLPKPYPNGAANTAPFFYSTPLVAIG